MQRYRPQTPFSKLAKRPLPRSEDEPNISHNTGWDFDLDEVEDEPNTEDSGYYSTHPTAVERTNAPKSTLKDLPKNDAENWNRDASHNEPERRIPDRKRIRKCVLPGPPELMPINVLTTETQSDEPTPLSSSAPARAGLLNALKASDPALTEFSLIDYRGDRTPATPGSTPLMSSCSQVITYCIDDMEEGEGLQLLDSNDDFISRHSEESEVNSWLDDNDEEICSTASMRIWHPRMRLIFAVHLLVAFRKRPSDAGQDHDLGKSKEPMSSFMQNSSTTSLQGSDGRKRKASQNSSSTDEGPKLSRRRGNNTPGQDEEKLLACPFCKNNPRKYRDCYKHILRNISRLKYVRHNHSEF